MAQSYSLFLQIMSSFEPARAVHWFIEETNIIIHRQMQLFPDMFIGVCGLPQVAGEPIENTLPELERCIALGFKGRLLNPEPYSLHFINEETTAVFNLVNSDVSERDDKKHVLSLSKGGNRFLSINHATTIRYRA
jgi:hypothetical protein